jgi:phage shock protein PspC (stress-responsive transcriptional regulator)
VCAGIARYLDVDVTVIRIIAIVLLFWPIPVVMAFAYLIAYAIMPEDPVEVAQGAGPIATAAAPPVA